MNSEFKDHIIKALNENIRLDGRGLTDYREITIETGVSSTAEGSAKVKFGETEVIVGIKMEIGKPFPDRPEEGAIMVNAEFLPMSSPDFESGPPGINAIELARVVDRGIRESGAIDLKKLSIKKGEKCWMIIIDICTINAGGNLLDASALGSISAIRDARFPKYENEELDYKTKTDRKIEMSKTPISVTVCKLGDNLFVDPLTEEEKELDARLTVTVTEDNTICALQKGGALPLMVEEIEKMLDLGLEKSKFLREKI